MAHLKRSRSAALLVSAAVIAAAVIFFYGRQDDVPQAETVSSPDTADLPQGQSFVNELHSLFTSSTTVDAACDQDYVSRGRSQVEWAEKTARIRRDAVSVLAASTTAEHKLAAALLAYGEMNAAVAVDLLVEAGTLDPPNPMIAARMLQMCQIAQEDCNLSLADLEMQSVTTDRGNADAWARVATSRASRSDYAGALDALQEAAAAPEFNEYYIDYILLFDRALAASAVDWSRHEPILRNYLDMYAATDEFSAMDYLQAEMAGFPEEEATTPSSCSDP